MSRLPTFLIIGAAKAGTTSLQAYLAQHPDVYFSPYKEPNYFAFADKVLPENGPASSKVLYELLYSHSVTTFDEYSALFRGADGHKAIGEASVRYLYYKEAPGRIQRLLPNVQLIVILREPVSRLYSHYCMNVQYQLEPLALLDAIKAEESRRAQNWGWDWHYVNVSKYAEQLERYLNCFDRGKIRVVFYDDFVQEPLRVFQETCRFIGVDDSFVPNMSKRGMVSRRHRNLSLDRWLHWPNRSRKTLERILPRRAFHAALARLERWNSLPAPPLDGALRAKLSTLFYDDLQHLESLVGRVTPWRS